MKQLFLLLLTVFFIGNTFINAQNNQRLTARFYGKVMDANSNKGLEFVSVQIHIKDSVLAGMFTRSNGDFSFDNVAVNDSMFLIITAIGYKKIERPINVKISEMNEMDLGNFSVEIEQQVLANVTVVATQPVLEMGIDRRVFNVEKSITATGGTAIDVMRNIPSVSVDVEGNVQLRNSSPQIFVDGRPTILTLDQIPADNIEKVELITNPSAKFDAASTGGIINVVIKKNKRIGINGTTSLSVGSPRVLGGNLNLNLREGKFNVFVSANYNKSGGNADSKTFRQNKKNGLVDNYFNQYSQNDRTRKFKSLRYGFDFFIDNRNTITISQNIVNGRFLNNEEQSQEYLNSSKVLTRTGIRTSDETFGFKRNNSQFIFTHKFSKTGQQISADVNYSKGSGDNLTYILNSYFNTNGTSYADPSKVRNVGDNSNDQLTLQVDYQNPIGDNAKIEAGIRRYNQNNTSIFNAYRIGQIGEETKLPLSNYYTFGEVVNAAYVTFSNKIDKFAYQAGLRVETSNFDGELIDKAQKFGYSYPEKIKNIWDALFPSLYLTKTIGDQEDIQLNYSRRIRRPNFWQLNPFIDINDPVNIRQGNPALRPEFTNSLEFNYNKNYTGGNFLGAIYYRNTLGDITRYSDTITAEQFQQLNNAAVDPNAILNTYINSISQNRLGIDLTWQQTVAKGLEIIPNLNLQYRKIKTDVANQNLSNEGFSWEFKLISNYKIDAPNSWLFKNIGLQLTGEYESPEVIPQGRRKEQYSVDFAMKKDFLKDKKGTFTFSINDLFNTRRFGSIYDTDNFYQDSYRRWNVRSFRITFSYKFGSSNFSLFKRGGRPEGGDSDRDTPPVGEG